MTRVKVEEKVVGKVSGGEWRRVVGEGNYGKGGNRGSRGVGKEKHGRGRFERLN